MIFRFTAYQILGANTRHICSNGTHFSVSAKVQRRAFSNRVICSKLLDVQFLSCFCSRFVLWFLTKYARLGKHCWIDGRSIHIATTPSNLGAGRVLFCYSLRFSSIDWRFFWFTNPFLQVTWYFTGDRGKSCLPSDKSRIGVNCLISAAQYNLAQDSASSHCAKFSSLSLLQITQFSILKYSDQVEITH
jgi:hypothetical protein